MNEQQLHQRLMARDRRLAWLWRAGHVGHYAGLVGALFSVAYWTGAFIVETVHFRSALAWSRMGATAVGAVFVFALLLVASVIVKFYAIKRAGIDLSSLGQETD